MSKKYTFREITEKDDLEKFFHMRYEVYSGCQCKSVLKSNGLLLSRVLRSSRPINNHM